MSQVKSLVTLFIFGGFFLYSIAKPMAFTPAIGAFDPLKRHIKDCNATDGWTDFSTDHSTNLWLSDVFGPDYAREYKERDRPKTKEDMIDALNLSSYDNFYFFELNLDQNCK